MEAKNYAEVLIDGKIYTMGGSEDEQYLQKVASYMNEKIQAFRKIPGFSRQSQEFQAVMMEINIADDYFKAQEQVTALERQRDEMEKEAYSLKHELVSTQMKLEAALQKIEEEKHKAQEAIEDGKVLKNRLDQQKAVHAATVVGNSYMNRNNK